MYTEVNLVSGYFLKGSFNSFVILKLYICTIKPVLPYATLSTSLKLMGIRCVSEESNLAWCLKQHFPSLFHIGDFSIVGFKFPKVIYRNIF